MNNKQCLFYFVVIGLFWITPSTAEITIQPGKIFNIVSYGAKGDGILDNTKAFINCLNDAVKTKNSIVVIPYGKYKINQTIDFYFTDQSLEIRGLPKAGLKPVIYSDNYIDILSVRGYSFKDLSKGSVTITNLKFSGKKSQYSSQHPYVRKSKFFHGIYISDKSKVYIENVDIENIYGQGIGIINTNQKMDGNGRFSYVSIRDCKLTNCWGYNPDKDDYGDGIYIANTKAGQLLNNTIVNKISDTKQLGRGGIVLEYYADNILIQNNRVTGYDRALHIEETNGAQKIIGNNFYGTDLGIVIYEIGKCEFRFPIQIKNNLVNNTNFYTTLKVSRVRTPRSLLNFLIQNNCKGGSIIEGNTFMIEDKYQFQGNSMLNILADNLVFRNNRFIIKTSKKIVPRFLINNDSQNTDFSGNTFDGAILKSNAKINSNVLIKQNVFLKGGKVE